MRGDEVQPEIYLQPKSQSNRLRAEIYFLAGIDRLARGKRRQARDLFEECVKTDYYEYLVYRWSRALLPLLDNEKWLPWIPIAERA